VSQEVNAYESIREVSNQRASADDRYIIIAIPVALVVMFAVNRFGGMLRNWLRRGRRGGEHVNVVDTTSEARSQWKGARRTSRHRKLDLGEQK
jgi:hypothetical protein